MSEYPINEMVSPSAQKELEKLLSELEKINSLAKSTTLSAGDAKSMKELADAQAKLNKLTADEEIHKKKLQALDQKMAIDRQKEIDRQMALQEKANKAELKELEAQAKAQAKLTAEAEKQVALKNKKLTAFKEATPGSINQLSAANAILSERLKGLNQQTESGAIKAERLRSAIDNNHKKMVAMSPDVVKQKDNIGNYGSVWDVAGNKIASFGSTLKGLALGGIATLGIGSIVGMFKKGVSSAIEMEEKIEKLNFALNESKPATDRMLAFAGKMSSQSLFGKGAIMEAETFALSLGRSEEQTKKMVVAAMGLSRVTGVDLQTAMTQLNMTYSGGVGRLAKYAPELKNMTEAQLKAGGAIDALSIKLGKFATSGLDTTEGKITMFKKALGGLTRTMTEESTGAIGTLVEAMTRMVKTVTRWVSVPTSEKLKAEQYEVNRLAGSLTNVNIPLKLRNENYDRLAKIAPEVLKGIDKESISIGLLTRNLLAYNNEAGKKIALAVKQEDLTKATEKASSAYRNMSSHQKSFDIMMDKMFDKIRAASGANYDLIVNQMWASKMSYQMGMTDADTYYNELSKLRKDYVGTLTIGEKTQQIDTNNRLRNSVEEYKKAEAEVANVMRDVADLQSKISTPTPTPTTTPTKTQTGKGKTQKEIDEEDLKRFLELNKIQQDKLKELADNELINSDVRKKAVDDLLAKKDEAAIKQLDFDLKYEKNAKNRAQIEKIYDIEGMKAFEEAQKQKVKIDIDYAEKSEIAKKELREKNLGEINSYYGKEITKLEIMANKEYELNAVAYAKGSKSKEDYEKEKLRISTQYAEDQLRLSIEMTEKQLQLLEEIDPVSRTKEENDKIASLHLELSKLKKDLADQELAQEEENWAKRAEMVEKYGETMKEILSTIGSLSSAIFERQSSDLESQHTKEEEAHQAELDAIDKKYNRSTKAKTAEELAKEKVDKKYAATEKKYEHDKAELARKQAIWKKGLAITEAVINTASSIAKVAYDPAQVILAGIVGAAQIATITMEKIPEVPKYRYGTDYHRGGLARFGEAGAELAITPSGQTIYAGSDTIMDLPRGTKVLTASVTREILENKITSSNGIDLTSLIEENKKSNNLLSKLVQKQQKSVIFVADNSRYNNYKYN